LHEGKLEQVPELAAAQRMKLKLEIITRLMDEVDEVDEERAALQNMLAL